MQALLNPIAQYLSETSYTRKILDAILVAALILVYGFASGHISLPKSEPHTVEHTFNKSSQIKKILDIAQSKAGVNVVSHFTLHNGVNGLSGYSFMKQSMTEVSTAMGVTLYPEEWQDLPIVINMSQIGALIEGKCYSSPITINAGKYNAFIRAGVQSITACPVKDAKGNLVGYVEFGSNSITPPSIATVESVAKEVEKFQW